VLGVLNSLPFDWQARRMVETHMNFFILNLLCFPPEDRTSWEHIGELAARLSCVDDRFDKFADQIGVGHGPVEDVDTLRAKIDALVAHAYGLEEEDLRSMFDDFTKNAVSDPYRELLLNTFREL
jgi:hypothetical protein